MTANTSFNLIALDPDVNEASLVAYLKNQPQFKDYDFAGSDIRMLVKMLVHNNYLTAFYTNMNMAESFLDSAQLYDSVSSHAKELNYLPRSARSSKARISVSFEATGNNQPYVIPKGASFSSLVKNDSFIFTIPDNISVTSSNNTFTFETDIYEGRYLQDSYMLTSVDDRFTITNDNVDITSLEVLVIEDGQTTPTKYKYVKSLLGLTEISKVFFLQMGRQKKYEVLFGDGVIGYKPKVNSVITLNYRISKFDKPDGARNFSINFDPTFPYSELTGTPGITTITNSIGGADREDIESVRFNAPRAFQTQERAVNPEDYPVILKEQFPEISAISTFGGEELSPPQFGKVFISVDISNVDGFPESKKIEYYDFIKSRMALTLKPVFIEPTYLYYHVESNIKYNLNLTSVTVEQVKSDIIQTLNDFNEQYLNDFDSTLYYSKLVAAIDDTASYIVSNDTQVKIYKTVNIVLGEPQSFIVDFGVKLDNSSHTRQNPVHNTHDARTVFSYPYSYRGETFFLENDNAGNIRVMKELGSLQTKVYDVGTVDYETGVVYISNIIMDSFEGVKFKLFAKTAEADISSAKNTIFTIDPDEIHITVEPVRV